MNLSSAIELVASRIRNLVYRSQLHKIGKGVRFGGWHITIVGGAKAVGKGITIGNNCAINDYCYLVTDHFNGQCGIEIGTNCHFNYGCYLSGTGGLQIGNDCLFGTGVKILTGGHEFRDPNELIINQGLTMGMVVIEDNCWIGAGATILPNVRIRTGAIVAAGAVVTKDVVSQTIVAGVPAAFLKARAPQPKKSSSFSLN